MILANLLGPKLTRVIEIIIKGFKNMATFNDVLTSVTELAEAQNVTQLVLTSLDAKLDEIRAFIQSLQGGTPVTQEQLDSLFAAIDSAKAVAVGNRVTADAVLAETDALDG